MDLLASPERRETEVCPDLRVMEVARVTLVSAVPKVPSALLVPLVFLVLKDRKVPKDQLVQLVRRETLD